MAAVVVVVVGGRSTSPEVAGAAPRFRLASTDGREVSLADYRGEAVLLYFNEGVGCDACFLQTAALEADPAFAGVDLTLLPIVMNQADDVQSELERFGVRTPYLSDLDGSVSRAYDTLGRGHHANLPGHTFVLVGPDGQVRWRGDYPSMWVEPTELVGSIKGLSD